MNDGRRGRHSLSTLFQWRNRRRTFRYHNSSCRNSWMVGFKVSTWSSYDNRPQVLSSLEGYSQTVTDVVNGSTLNFFLNDAFAGFLNAANEGLNGGTSELYAPPGHVLIGMSYSNDNLPYSSPIQFKYVPLASYQQLASFSISDNCNDSLSAEFIGNTSFGCSDIGSNSSVMLIATDVSGNTTSCEIMINVFDSILPTITCPSNISVPGLLVRQAQSLTIQLQ